MGGEKYLSGLKYFRKASEIEMTKNTLSITARQVSKRLNIDSISLERRIGMAIVLAIKPIRAEKLGKILSNIYITYSQITSFSLVLMIS